MWGRHQNFEDQSTGAQDIRKTKSDLLGFFLKHPLLKPPDYDPRDIVALVEKYGDAHISDSGWRPIDPEEWFSDN